MDGVAAPEGNLSKLSVPLDFLTEIANAESVDDLYVSIAKWLPIILPADRISIALPVDGDTLHVAAVQGDEIRYGIDDIPVRGSKIGECYRTRQPIVVSDADRPGEKYADLITPGKTRYRSTAILPLSVGDRCLGTLNFGCDRPDSFPDDVVENLRQIATWIALQFSRYEALERLTASEARFNALVENANSVIFAKTLQGEILLANEMYCKNFGVTRDQVVGRTEAELFGEEMAQQWRKEDERILASGSGETFEGLLTTVEGDNKNFMTQKFPVYDPGRGEYIICAISTDISRQRQVEDALSLSEQRARAFFNNSPTVMYTKDLKHVLRHANTKYLEFYGKTEDEVLGSRADAYLDPETLAQFEITEREIVAANQVHRSEARIVGADGEPHDFIITKFPVHDANDNVVGIGGINTDITELRVREKELEIAKEEAIRAAMNFERAADRAQSADQAKTEFLASMSHELRTPLNGILGMTHLLMLDELDQNQRSKVETIQESGDALLTILNDILDLSKVEAGELEIDPREFRLSDLMATIEGLWEPQAVAKELAWSCVAETTVAPVLMGDDARLRQIVFNLVSNALKFTEAGEIAVRVTQRETENGKIENRFEVSDTGPGIAAEHHERLFEKFTQADSTTSRRYGGTGLGLAICESLVHLMGGEIGIESVVGTGTTFWFTVVCDRGTEGALAETADTGPHAGPAAPRQLKILVAEDNAVNQKIVTLMLQRGGHECHIVCNGAEAVSAARDDDYDLILMDIQMPEMDGIAATRSIREIGGPRSETPIIALTANAMKGDREIYLKAGMNDYVAKPIDPAALVAALGRQAGAVSDIPAITPAAGHAGPVTDEAELSDELDALFDGFDIPQE